MTTSGLNERLARLSPTQRAEFQRLLDEQHTRTATATAPDTGDGAPRDATEEVLARVWGECLGVPTPGVHDDFWSLGGDSIIGMQIAARAGAEGVAVSPQQVLQAGTVAALAELASAGGGQRDADDEPLGEVPPTPIQRWFFEQDLPEARTWDQTLFLPVRRPLARDLLHRALCAVVAHHEVLRSTFRPDPARGPHGWRHEVRAEAPDPTLTVVRLPAPGDAGGARDAGDSRDARGAGDTVGRERAAREDAAVESAQRSLDLAEGPLIAAVLLEDEETDGAPGARRLVLVAHHLVVDGISLRLLTDDLERAYRALEEGRTPRLPARTTSFRRWAELLHRWAAHPDVLAQAPHWLAVPDTSAATIPFRAPAEVPPEERRNTIGRSATVWHRLGQDVTDSLLRDAPARGLSPRNVLLAALLRAWPRTPGATGLQLDLEAHGREVVEGGANVSRTVGWFTSIFPVRLPFTDGPDADAGPGSDGDPEAETAAVGRALDAVPHKGLGYGLLRYLDDSLGNRLAELPQSQVSFNYLGRFERPGGDAVFGPPEQAPSVLQSDQVLRRYLLDVVVTAMDKELVVELTYARDHVTAEDAHALTARYVEHLTALARGAARPTGPRAVGVDEDQMSAIERRMGLR